MKKIFLAGFLFFQFLVFSQEDAWVYFNAKANIQNYLDQPLSMLSQRALDRRIAQHISLDEKDIPINMVYVNEIAASSGISVKAISKWFNAVHVQGSLADIKLLSSLSFVDHLEFANRSLNIVGKIAAPKKIEKVRSAYKVQASYNYGNSANQIQMLNGVLLHQHNYTGLGKVIAVMDGGFPGVNSAVPFSRLRDNNQILGGYDYVNRNSDFYSGIEHGSMVLSTMGGYLDNQLVGTAPDASYYLFVTEDGSREGPLEMSLWVEAAEEADRLGVDIITTSLGYTEFDNSNYNFTYADMNGRNAYISRGVDLAFSRGIICVVSAGNEGNKSWKYISAPADAIHAVAVGAVNSSGNYVSFSSEGPSFDQRIKPDLAAQGQSAIVSNSNGSIVSVNGTSFSAPIVAGLLASLWQALPNKTNAEIVDLIKESASLFANPNVEMGYGIPDFNLALNTGLKAKEFKNVPYLLYPNPFKETLFLKAPANFENASFSLYTSLGQKVKEDSILEINSQFDVNSLNSGLYFYKIQYQNYMQSGKIIKL